jgi:hypothetical protein
MPRRCVAFTRATCNAAGALKIGQPPPITMHISATLAATAAVAFVLQPFSSTAGGGKEPVPLEKISEPELDRPLPFGLSVLYIYQEQDYKVTGLDATLPKLKAPRITKLPPGTIPAGLPPQYAAIATAKALALAQQAANRAFQQQIAQIPTFDRHAIRNVRNEVTHVNARFDWWVLPMLNFQVLYGQFDGSAKATLAPALAKHFGDIEVDYDGQSYGLGATLAAGWKQIFAAVSVDYHWSDVDFNDLRSLKLVDDDSIRTLVVRPKIGYRFTDSNLSVWVGAQYQKTKHTQKGSFNMPGLGRIPFSVDVEDAHPWNWLAGFEWGLSRHWSIIAEGGFGQRKQALAGLSFRF